MKRLKSYILGLLPGDTLYRSVYEGEMLLDPSPDYKAMEPTTVYDAVYWYKEDFGFSYSITNKLAHDLPTIVVKIPAEMLGIAEATPAAADFCLREFIPFIDGLNEQLYNRSRPEKENGGWHIFIPSRKIVERNAAYFTFETGKYYDNLGGAHSVERRACDQKPERLWLNLMLQAQLPFKKHSKTLTMLTKSLPMAVEDYTERFDRARLKSSLELANLQKRLRSALSESKYCAFIADGSILPREKSSEKPMENAIPFKSPPEDELELCGVCGMGVKRGVTVITGGGYSGKSTLLDAISEGIYDHAAGDGRELVITDGSAMEIASEDGRPVRNIDISPFIKWIPGGDPTAFSTDHASGSTSQAANIVEAVGCGCRLLLIDEDRSATNFMIRDSRMKRLIRREPITPFTERAEELYAQRGVSTILVIGGSGEYLSVADNVILMNDFRAENALCAAREICASDGETKGANTADIKEKPAVLSFRGTVESAGFTSYPDGSGTERMTVTETGFLYIGSERVDTRALYNLTSIAQLNAVGYILRDMMIKLDREKTLSFDVEKAIREELEQLRGGRLDEVYTSFFTSNIRWMELPRALEVLAVINRMKNLRLN